jgi:hypothetical protein
MQKVFEKILISSKNGEKMKILENWKFSKKNFLPNLGMYGMKRKGIERRLWKCKIFEKNHWKKLNSLW